MDTDTDPETPGTMLIRPTREEAERNPDHFYALLGALRSPETLPLRKIAEIVGDTSLNPEPNILRKIKNRTLSRDARRYLLRHIYEEQPVLSGGARERLAAIDHALHFALLNFLNIGDARQDTARALLVGTYRVWRHSIDHEDEFILGKQVVVEDPKTRALKVQLTLLERIADGTRRVPRRLSGYFLGAPGAFLCLVRDLLSDDVRVALFPDFRIGEVGTTLNPNSVFAGRQTHVLSMDGFAFGIDGRRTFCTPVHLSLVDDVDELAKLSKALNRHCEDELQHVPAGVAHRLRRAGPLRRL